MDIALNLNEAIARVPMWANNRDLQISTLGGGITNSNYRIDTGGESFVLRIAGADTELLGITREYEYTANLAAGKLGIAPEVIYMIQPEGYLVTRFITARPFLPEEITQPENICRVMEIVRKIHSMPEIPGTFSVFRTIDAYGEVARRYNVEFPKNFAWLMEQTHLAEAALKYESQALRPCHNDLLNANFLIDDRIYILDWEYAGMGNIFFDLANFSDHHELSDEQDQWLLECYFEEVTDIQTAHFKIMKVMSNFREAMWAMVQIGISQLDFDYQSYANRFFGRVFENINDPRWNQWINKLNNND
jgi:thiamine kinase-like enzyme